MTAEQYAGISAPFRTPAKTKLLRLVNKLLTLGVYFFYLIWCAWMLMTRDGRLLPALLIPAVPFVLLSVFRKSVNAPRPYEALDIEPLIIKNTRGKSFPSRHVFSVFVIAMASLLLSPVACGALIVGGVLLAVIRVIGGVHFPKDVIAGAVIGIVSGGIGLLIASNL